MINAYTKFLFLFVNVECFSFFLGLRSKSMIPPPNAAKNSKIAYMPKSDVTVSHDDTVLQQRPAEKENNKPSTVSK